MDKDRRIRFKGDDTNPWGQLCKNSNIFLRSFIGRCLQKMSPIEEIIVNQSKSKLTGKCRLEISKKALVLR